VNGARGTRDIEHAAIGNRAGRLQRSWREHGSASDQGKVARVVTSEFQYLADEPH